MHLSFVLRLASPLSLCNLVLVRPEVHSASDMHFVLVPNLTRNMSLFQQMSETRSTALPVSAQDTQLFLRRSLQLRILHLARVACKSDVLGTISKVETESLLVSCKS